MEKISLLRLKMAEIRFSIKHESITEFLLDKEFSTSDELQGGLLCCLIVKTWI